MMTKLREMTFIFIWILVIAFVALMVFEWGMDFTGLNTQPNIVGKINGNKITIQDFQQAVQKAVVLVRAQINLAAFENQVHHRLLNFFTYLALHHSHQFVGVAVNIKFVFFGLVNDFDNGGFSVKSRGMRRNQPFGVKGFFHNGNVSLC